MTTVGELLHNLRRDDVLSALSSVFQRPGEDPEGYGRLWDSLLQLQPKNTTMSCLLHIVIETYKDEPSQSFVDVSGIKPNDEAFYSLLGVDREEWLSMEVVLSPGMPPMSDAEKLAHILYEAGWL